jgi:hypothetical protein
VVDRAELEVVLVDRSPDADQILLVDLEAQRAGELVRRREDLLRAAVAVRRDDAAALVRRLGARVGDDLLVQRARDPHPSRQTVSRSRAAARSCCG